MYYYNTNLIHLLQAFQLVDKGAFRRLLIYTRPSLSERDIPHRTKVQQEILLRARGAEVKVSEALANIKGKVSFTFDTWTSDAQDPYLSVTGHYITAPEDRPQDWELKSEQLAFTHFEGNHSGVNMANVLIRTIDRYNLRNKVCINFHHVIFHLTLLLQVGWFTADNASNNGVALRELKVLLVDRLFDAKQHYIRYIYINFLQPNSLITFADAWNILWTSRLRLLYRLSHPHQHERSSRR